jgi:hypothetical protein
LVLAQDAAHLSWHQVGKDRAMRDYDKELADSLDKSDQIAKLEAKVEELQRQLADAQELASQINTDWIPANKKLAEQLAEAQEAGRYLSLSWGDCSKQLEETKLDLQRAIKQRNDWDEANTLHIRQLAERDEQLEIIKGDFLAESRKVTEREAVIENMSQIAEHVIAYLDDNLSYDREADYAIEQLNELRKMADEIRSK